jgi:Tol biopolymer transport system component
VGKSLVILSCALTAASIAHADRLIDTQQIARGDYLGPQFSPDGKELLLTGPRFEGLFVARSGGAVQQLTADPEAGVHAQWNADGSVAYRAKRAGTRRDLVVGRDANVRIGVAKPQLAFAKDDLVYVTDRAGKVTRVGSGDKFFGTVVSRDGDKVIYQGLSTGLYLYIRSTGATRYIGPGTAPAWSPDSRRVVFEVTEDDGHDIVASDLYVYDVAADRVSPITSTDRVIERRPAFAPNGTSIAFDDNTGGVYVGRLEVQ